MVGSVANPHVDSIRRHIKHPIIDSDAHYNEFAPSFRDAFLEAARQTAGANVQRELASAPDIRRYLLERTSPAGQAFGSTRWLDMSAAQRKDTGTIVPGWSPPHSNMLDRATSFLPGLLHERMEQMGIEVQDVHDLFIPRFFFGCEADDPITPWAFNTNGNPPEGPPASDVRIGHGPLGRSGHDGHCPGSV